MRADCGRESAELRGEDVQDCHFRAVRESVEADQAEDEGTEEPTGSDDEQRELAGDFRPGQVASGLEADCQLPAQQDQGGDAPARCHFRQQHFRHFVQLQRSDKVSVVNRMQSLI